MDPVSVNPSEIIELVAAVGGLGVTGLLGYLVVRRARASRRRQIEQAGEPQKIGSATAEEEVSPEEVEAEETVTPESDNKPTAKPAPAKRDRSAQVIPFPAQAPERAITPTPEPSAESRPQHLAEPQAKPAPPSVPPPRPKKDAGGLAPGLARTRSGWVSRLGEVFAGRKELDVGVVDDIEKVLLTADIGVRTSQKLLEELRSSLTRKELRDPDAVWMYLRQRSSQILTLDAPSIDFGASRPFVLLVIGVNGSGKTTTIGKLAAKIVAGGKKVMLAAGDTFRAAATEQLDIWASRVGATLVRGKEGADPSSVIFDAVKRAVAEGFDVVIADTAGRLHTKTDLMEELQKIRRVIGKATPGAPHQTWLVIDATSGQNAIAQAQMFTQAMSVSGIVLTKLDGTAKGGVILGIADQLQIPVRYVGIGERVEDLREFDPEEFVDALYQQQPHPPAA
ncbi:MAG TPA: signal recognition particle-docking protein FtsY [Polyangia bacterium]|jgi:fused signal recognition particle receptor|nr:signal recognition particle-docking protein FtsY [Polyangia bacterium]